MNSLGDDMSILVHNRRWLLFLLVLISISSCSDDTTRPPQSVTLISEETVVIDEDSDISVTSIVSSLIVYDASQGDPENLPFEVGDILVSDEHGSYLRRVASIEVSGDSVLVQTEDAALAEVIVEGGFNWFGPLEFDLSMSMQKGEVGYVHPALNMSNIHASSGLSFSLDGLGIDLGSGAEIEVQEGSFLFEPSLDIDGEFDHGIQEFHAVASGDLDFNILAELVLTASAGVSGEIELISDLPASAPIHIQVGWVPIVIYPEFDLLLGAETSASGFVSLTSGVETDSCSIETGFHWTESGGFEVVNEKNFRGDVYPMEVSSQISHQSHIYLKPRLSFMVYTMAGPYIALKPYAGLTGTVYPPPQDEYCTEWSLGLAGEVGANLEIFEWGISAGLDLVDWSFVLDDENCEEMAPESCCLAAFYPLDGSGLDVSGNGNHGVVHGCTPSGDRNGLNDRAYTFDGSDDFIEIMSSESIVASSDKLTLACWLYIDGAENDGGVLYKGVPGVNRTFVLTYQNGNSMSFSTTTNNGEVTLNGLDNVTQGEWHHIAAVYDGSFMYLYWDGAAIGETAQSGPLSWDEGAVQIGRYNGVTWQGWTYLPCIFDDVQIYTRALSAGEIEVISR